MQVYSIQELLSEQPKGDVTIRDDAGKLWSAFCCHGCQSCLFFIDPLKDDIGVHYPHYLKLEPAV